MLECIVIEALALALGEVNYLTDIDGNKVALDMTDEQVARDIVASLSAYVEAVRPPVLLEHLRDGYQRGRVLSVRDGEIDGRRGIIARLELYDSAMIANAHLIRRVSPYLLTNATTASGVTYPYGLAEISAVSVPMVDVYQPDARIAAASDFGGLRADSSYAILAQEPIDSATLAQSAEPEPMTPAEFLVALQADEAMMAQFRALFAPPVAPPQPVAVEPVAMPAVESAAPMAPPVDIAMAAQLDKIEGLLSRIVNVAPTSTPGAIAAAAGRGVVGGVAAPVKRSVNEVALAISLRDKIDYRDAFRIASAGGV